MPFSGGAEREAADIEEAVEIAGILVGTITDAGGTVLYRGHLDAPSRSTDPTD